jgi:protein-tyrosine phosphatase
MTRVSWMTERLCVGGSLGTADWPELCSHRVRHVVDLRSEQQDDSELLETHGLQLLLLPTDDHHAIAEEALERGVAWVRMRLDRGEPVFIHCEHGIGRSVLLTACVLVAEGDSPQSTLRRIKRARPIASPSPAQLEAFIRFCERRGHAGLRFEELAGLVYGERSASERS